MNTLARAAALVVALGLLTGTPGAQQPAGQQPAEPQAAGQQPPAGQPAQDPATQPDRAPQPFRTGINFVRVDVIVTDRQGNPVLDLKPEDFTVLEDGKPQAVEQFSVVKIDAVTQMEGPRPGEIRSDYDEEREASRPDVRLFTILLDDYHVRRGNDLGVRKPLIDFIQNQLGPADMVAIMYPLTSVTDIRFTRNREALVREIEQFLGRKGDYTPRNMFEEQYAYYPAITVERIRNEVVMGALKAAAVRMGGLREGRKSVIFVSEGFTTNLPAQVNDPIAAMPGVGNTARRDPTDYRNDRAEFYNQVDLITLLRDVFDIANRNNTSIYAVDPRGLAVFEYGVESGVPITADSRGLRDTLDSLHMVAENTDGRAIVNRNDLAVGMRQIIRDASGYYLLGYTSSQAPTDGRFHEIKVRVNRRNVDVRARKGYWALSAEEAARATAPPKPEAPPAITAALSAIAEPPRGRPARFWIGTSRGESGRTRVTFVWEPTPPAPGERSGEGAQAARVALTATAPDGRPLFRGRVPDVGPELSDVAPPPAAPTTQTGRAGASTTFEAPPGQVQLKMVVEGPRGNVMDSVTREFTLPDYTAVQVSFGTPRIYRGRTVRDIQNLKAMPDAVPVVEREFSRAERVLLRVDAYAPGGVTPIVSARLLSRGGAAMSDLPVQMAGATADIEFALSGLAAGEYLIELNAKTDAGSAQEILAFKVGR
jgi:VWFA-related protein